MLVTNKPFLPPVPLLPHASSTPYFTYMIMKGYFHWQVFPIGSSSDKNVHVDTMHVDNFQACRFCSATNCGNAPRHRTGLVMWYCYSDPSTLFRYHSQLFRYYSGLLHNYSILFRYYLGIIRSYWGLFGGGPYEFNPP